MRSNNENTNAISRATASILGLFAKTSTETDQQEKNKTFCISPEKKHEEVVYKDWPTLGF